MRITMLAYPRMTLLDLVGPLQVWTLWPDAQIQLVAHRLDPLLTDTVVTVLPSHTFEAAAADPDILFVPGGADGTLAAMRDPPTIEFLKKQGPRAKWVTSVCTGALVLGAAGLLEGYRATTHWSALDRLADFGATAVDERWVIDRNRATGGGVTAGIDFGLALMAQVAGESVARVAQLLTQYAPQPPFASGTPGEAQAETLAAADALLGTFNRELQATARACSQV